MIDFIYVFLKNFIGYDYEFEFQQLLAAWWFLKGLSSNWKIVFPLNIILLAKFF